MTVNQRIVSNVLQLLGCMPQDDEATALSRDVQASILTSCARVLREVANDLEAQAGAMRNALAVKAARDEIQRGK